MHPDHKFSPERTAPLAQHAAMEAALDKEEKSVIPVEKKKDPARGARWAALLGSNAADALSTSAALKRPGTREANPAMAGIAGNPLALLGTKLGMGILEGLLMDALAKRGKTKLANGVGFGIAGLNGALAISNSRKGKE